MKKTTYYSIFSGLILLLIMAVSPVLATDYFVDSTGGNDSNDGLSPATAWETVGKVNNSMYLFNPGDNILFQRNRSYRGQGRLDIEAGGSAGSYIVFGAYGSGYKPILDEILCNEYGVGYVAVEYFTVNHPDGGIAFTNYNHNVRITGCDINGMNTNGIVITRVDTYIIDGCVITDCGNSGIAIIGSATYKVTNGLIRNNRISNIHQNDGITLHVNNDEDECGPNHQLIGNICYNCAENGLDITSGTNILIRGNVTFGNTEAGTLCGGTEVGNIWIDRHYAFEDEYGIAFGGNVNVKLTSSIIYNANYHQLVIVPVTSLVGFEAYHNTFVFGPNSTGLILDINSGVRNVTFKNNLFVSTKYSDPQTYIKFSDGATPSSVNANFDYNTYWRNDGDGSNRWNVGGNISFSQWQSIWGQDIHGQWIDPRLVSLTGKDYHLQADSPCIDAGISTSVRRDFEGTLIPTGIAPDVGAYEYDSGSPPPPPELQASLIASPSSGEVPLSVQFTGSASGGTSPYSYSWSFGTGQTSSAQNPYFTYNETGDYAVTLTVTDSENTSDSTSVTIRVYAISITPLEATVSASPRSGMAPLTVHFAASATGGTPPYSYRWRYGNGDSSRKKDPTYTYTEGGNFRATLTVSDEHNNQIVKSMIIKISDLSVLADFSCAPSGVAFGATVAGIQTPAQSFHILDNGYGVVNWSVSADKGWLSCSPVSGDGSGEIFVTIDPKGLPPGKHTGKISVFSPNAITSPQHIAVTLDIYEQDGPPIGSMDSPVDGSYVSGSIPISGWALDDIEVTRVDIKRPAGPNDIPDRIGTDGLVHMGEAIFLDRTRLDIPDAYPDYPLTHKGGWGYVLRTYQLPNKGTGPFTIFAIATDTSGQSVNIGTRTIYCDNISGSLPFGAIESPERGEVMPGKSFTSTGWALTPPPSSIPEDGSTIWMWIDGMRLGHPVYNQYREDIASLFPEYFNSQGAGVTYDFNTTPYPDGDHTLFLSATDNAGSTKAIDATYFTIMNGDTDDSQLGYLEAKGIYLEDTEGALNLGIQELKKDYTLETDGNITKDEDGTLVIHTEEMKPLHILFETNEENIEHFFGWGEEDWAKLPVGSTLIQEEGRFCWIPAPGFLGDFFLHFAFTDGKTISQPLRVKVIISTTNYDKDKKKQRKIKR